MFAFVFQKHSRSSFIYYNINKSHLGIVLINYKDNISDGDMFMIASIWKRIIIIIYHSESVIFVGIEFRGILHDRAG